MDKKEYLVRLRGSEAVNKHYGKQNTRVLHMSAGPECVFVERAESYESEVIFGPLHCEI